MIRIASSDDLRGLHSCASRANEAPYDLAPVLEEKCFGRGAGGGPLTRVFEAGGAIRGFAVTCGAYLRLIAVDRDHRRCGIGSELLGGARIAGAEPGNYFTPGVAAGDETTIAFLRAHGFRETASTWNLTARPEESPTRAPGIVVPDSGARERFLSFVEREFGSIWRFEAARAFETAKPTALWIEDIGFVVWEANNRGLGTFGPTGVAKSRRGEGHGRALLLAALSELRGLGYEKVTIPWTDALEFYRRSCGAEPAHRFLTFGKPLLDSAP